MFSSTLILGCLPILALGASFQDSFAPQDKIAARVAAPAPQNGDGPFYCSAIVELFSICEIGTVSQAATDAAGCLCYSSTSWAPQIFDGAASSCADYAQTANLPDAYTIASDFEDFCTSVGNYQASPAAATTPIAPHTTVPVVGTTTSPKPTPIATTPPLKSSAASASLAASSGGIDIFTANPACSTVGFAFDFCNSASPGFSTLDATSQAPCLCYSSMSWDPNYFDDQVRSCASFASTADPSDYPTITAVEGFCSSVGDVLNTGGAPASSAGVAGGIGISGGGGGPGVATPGPKSSTKAPTTLAPVATTTPVQTLAPAVTTIKSGDSTSIESLFSWVLQLTFVVVSMAVLL